MVIVMQENKSSTIDAQKATLIVKKYFSAIHDNLGLLAFKVEKVEPNSAKDVWKVSCSFYPSIGSSQRSYYMVRVNINTGIVDVTETKRK